LKLKRELKKNATLFLMAMPVVVAMILFNYMPMFGLVVAFKNFNIREGIWGSRFNGLKNFEFLFKTSDAWLITRNTLLYNFVIIALGTVIAISFAILLNELRSKKMSRLFQTIIIMPFFLSWVCVSFIGYAFMNPDKGMLNVILEKFGAEAVMWYSRLDLWPYVLVITAIWKSAGYNSVMYLASILGISSEYYEAALIDGANKRQQIRYITLPLLKPMVIILTLMAIGKVFYSDFGLFYQLPRNSGQLYSVTSTIDTYVYTGLKVTANIGMSTAANFYQSMVGFILVLSANLIVRKIDPEYSLF